jgi:hypothetical protein
MVVIGKQWLRTADAAGRRRLDNPKDIVRLEIATALKRGIAVVPLLVDDVDMPRAEELPRPLRGLPEREFASND